MMSRSAAGIFAVSTVMDLLLAGGPYAGTAYACSCAGTSNVAAASLACVATPLVRMARP